MLKKIMKAALAASLVFGMSSFAYAAEGKIGGSFKEYFGQYNSGVSGTDGYWANYGEGNLKFTGKSGKASVFFEIQADTGESNSGLAGAAAAELSDVQRKVSYTSPIGQVSIGTIVNIGTVPFNTGAGWKTSSVPNSTRRGLVVSGYKESDGVDLVIPLEGMGFVQATMYSQAGVALTTQKSGNVMQLGANLAFSGIGVRLGYSSEKVDDPTVSTDGDDKSTGMLLAANVPLGEMMSISASYATFKKEVSAVETEYSSMDVCFVLGGVGPGKLFLSYDMMAVKDVFDYANIHAVYDVETEKGAGFQFGYLSNGSKPKGGTSTTASAILGGIYAAF